MKWLDLQAHGWQVVDWGFEPRIQICKPDLHVPNFHAHSLVLPAAGDLKCCLPTIHPAQEAHG